MAVVVPGVSVNMSGHIQSQFTRSLERILEDANLSGELKLSGRKLKDFPKTGKYNLNDTVIADLSKNRFGEVPDEVTAFLFLERLLLYHNAIRNVPDTIGSLQSLSYLDLSRNQLTEVPRELCQLPLQVLLLYNNSLNALPKEIGKMTLLQELDASGNQIAHLPMTIGDLGNLRVLSLKNNQLGLLPIQITYLHLEVLNVSCNCISSLPLELRHMTSLVILDLEHNPLVSPPATICVRGRIHIFKYLENQANKDNLQRRGDDTRRSVKQQSHHNQSILHNHNQSLPQTQGLFSSGHIQPVITPACPAAVEGLRHKARYNVDSGYSTSDGGEKRWSTDGMGAVDEGGGTANGAGVMTGAGAGSGRSTPSTPSTISPGPNHMSRAHSLSAETPPLTPTLGCRISPDGGCAANGDGDKSRPISHQQTYRQYKEALRVQRQQDVYRPRSEQTSPPSAAPSALNHSHSTPHSPVANGYHHRNIVSSNPSLSTPLATNSGSPTNSPLPSNSTGQRRIQSNSIFHQSNGSDSNIVSANNYAVRVPTSSTDDALTNRRPVQKVIPSRSTNKNYSPTGIPVSNSNNTLSPTVNGNTNFDYSTSRLSTGEANRYACTSPQDGGGYVKPVSPIKSSSTYMSHNNVPVNRANSLGRNANSDGLANGSDPACGNSPVKLLTTSVAFLSNTGTGAGNPARLNWNKDIPSDKLSFTMKREFDRAKEESELTQELRRIIENRLKMILPRDLAPVLADGVVLCHLANNVRPRSVTSVYVPSPAQPKLSMARCRRNVDNFLEACRKIGVDEGAVCDPQDILPMEDSLQEFSYERMEAVFVTVTSLLSHRVTTAHVTDNHTVPISQERNADPLNRYQDMCTAEDSQEPAELTLAGEAVLNASDNTEHVDNTSAKFRNNLNFFQSKPVYRNRYAEDRCISNFSNSFNDQTDADDIPHGDSNNFIVNRLENLHFENNNADVILDNNKMCQINFAENGSAHNQNQVSQAKVYNSYGKADKINFVVPLLKDKISHESSIIREQTLPQNGRRAPEQSIITERIKYFSNKRPNMNLDIKNNLNTIQDENVASVKLEESDRIISWFCLGAFISTLVLLYVFPLPN